MTRKAAFLFGDLSPCLSTNDALELTYDSWVRMGPCGGAKEIKGGVDISYPVTKSLVDSVLEGAGTACNAYNFGSQDFHPSDV